MKIIGHRGAAGLALENTIESIHSAIEAGVDAIEIDIRVTQDDHVVLCHDRDTTRIGHFGLVIHQSSLEEVRSVNLHEGKSIPTLKEAIKAAGTTPLVIEGKSDGWSEPLAKILKKTKPKDVRVISFNHKELFQFGLLCRDIPVYALERTKPLDVLHTANLLGFDGIDLNFWILNPLVYWMARRQHLDVIVYTVNKPWIARFLKFLYPHISITTDVPHKMAFLSDKKRASRRQTKIKVKTRPNAVTDTPVAVERQSS